MIITATILATIGGLIVGYLIRRPKKLEQLEFDGHCHYMVGQFLGMMENETDHRKAQEWLGSAIFYQMSLEREKQTGDRFVELSQDDWEMRCRMLWNLLDEISLETEGFVPFRNAVVHLHLDEQGQWVCKPRPDIFRKPKSNLERIAEACDRVMGDRASVERIGDGLVKITRRESNGIVH